jgi:pyruvyltransferase
MNEIVECECVLSSTLHGIIVSESYGIPNAHMELSDKGIGEYHKFDDDFQSDYRNRTSCCTP